MSSLWLSCALLLCLVDVFPAHKEHPSAALSKFSGFYRPDTSANIEPFASAWLISKRKFLKSKRAFDGITNFEGTVFSVLGRGAASKKNTIMTRDYFDFQVEHLSSTLNTLEDMELFGILGERLDRRIEALRRLPLDRNSSSLLQFSRTLAIIPFSSAGAHAPEEQMKQLRIRMFSATFWSLRRHNFEVVVSVSSPEDLVTLQLLQLPIFHVYTFYELTRKSEQPKRSLLQAVSDISTEESWRHFEFVYYSDADQILHMRNMDIIYSTLLLDKQMVLCPHRLHTMTLPTDVPKHYRHPKHFMIADLISYTQSSSLILERGLHTRGSCCDDGRFFITNSSVCNNNWYFCDSLHPFTLLEWIKFGPHGWPAPLTTEHLGKCRYYPVRRQCDVPKDCHDDRGSDMTNAVASDGSKICKEISKAYFFKEAL